MCVNQDANQGSQVLALASLVILASQSVIRVSVSRPRVTRPPPATPNMSLQQFLLEPITCHAWNRDRSRKTRSYLSVIQPPVKLVGPRLVNCLVFMDE